MLSLLPCPGQSASEAISLFAGAGGGLGVGPGAGLGVVAAGLDEDAVADAVDGVAVLGGLVVAERPVVVTSVLRWTCPAASADAGTDDILFSAAGSLVEIDEGAEAAATVVSPFTAAEVKGTNRRPHTPNPNSSKASRLASSLFAVTRCFLFLFKTLIYYTKSRQSC